MNAGKHYRGCKERFPGCPCCSCAMDNAGESELPCCDKHGLFCDNGKICPDYIPEDAE